MIRKNIENTIENLTDEVLISVEQWRSEATRACDSVPASVKEKLEIIEKLTEILESEDNRDNEDATRRLDAYKTVLQASAGVAAFFGFLYSVCAKYDGFSPIRYALYFTFVGIWINFIILILFRYISERKLVSIRSGFWKDIIAIVISILILIFSIYVVTIATNNINSGLLAGKSTKNKEQNKELSIQSTKNTDGQNIPLNAMEKTNKIVTSNNNEKNIDSDKMSYPYPTIYISNDSSSYSGTYPTGAPGRNQHIHPKPRVVLDQKGKADFCKCVVVTPPK